LLLKIAGAVWVNISGALCVDIDSIKTESHLLNTDGFQAMRLSSLGEQTPYQLNSLGRLMGFEPTTFASTGRRSAVELQPPYIVTVKLYH
jgi:hypothetical protein